VSKKPKVYSIHCAHCKEYLLTYNKFGSGKGILRLYLSNISALSGNIDIDLSTFRNINDVPHLICPSCEELIGVASVAKGKRWVYKMRQGHFHRKLRK